MLATRKTEETQEQCGRQQFSVCILLLFLPPLIWSLWQAEVANELDSFPSMKLRNSYTDQEKIKMTSSSISIFEPTIPLKLTGLLEDCLRTGWSSLLACWLIFRKADVLKKIKMWGLKDKS